MTRNVLITGVSRGLGHALAQGIASAGHRVAGCARRIDDVQAPEAIATTDYRVDSVDLSDDQAVGLWIADVVQNWGVPDLVINNAGVINANKPLWEVPYAEFQQLMRVNVQGVFSVIRHVVPHLLSQQQGVIANLSSGWGRSVSAEVAPYCCTKWGIEGLTLALAEDLPKHLAAVPVNPGIINTEMLQSCFGDNAKNAPTPAQWAESAVPFFLGLGAKDNGKSLSV